MDGRSASLRVWHIFKPTQSIDFIDREKTLREKKMKVVQEGVERCVSDGGDVEAAGAVLSWQMR